MENFTIESQDRMDNVWQRVAAERNPNSQTAQTARGKMLETQHEILTRRINKDRKGSQSVMVVDPVEVEKSEPAAIQPFIGTDPSDFFKLSADTIDELDGSKAKFAAEYGQPRTDLIEAVNRVARLKADLSRGGGKARSTQG